MAASENAHGTRACSKYRIGSRQIHFLYRSRPLHTEIGFATAMGGEEIVRFAVVGWRRVSRMTYELISFGKRLC
jgi:hypothetical protein